MTVFFAGLASIQQSNGRPHHNVMPLVIPLPTLEPIPRKRLGFKALEVLAAAMAEVVTYVCNRTSRNPRVV